MSKFFKFEDGYRLKLSDDGTIAVFEEDDGSIELGEPNEITKKMLKLFWEYGHNIPIRRLKAALQELPNHGTIKISIVDNIVNMRLSAPIFMIDCPDEGQLPRPEGRGLI